MYMCAVNALRCDVWVVVHALQCALLLVSLVFREGFFFGGSASLHDLFLHFLQSVTVHSSKSVLMYIVASD